MINRILERLEELIEKSFHDSLKGNPFACARNGAYHEAKEIVQEVAKESKAPIRCLTCARYTDNDKIDNTCYLCCKGYEDSYVAKEKE